MQPREIKPQITQPLFNKDIKVHVLKVDYQMPNAAELFCHSLKNTGFSVLCNHPISTQLIAQTYDQWKDFFSSENKFNYCPEKTAQDGYFAFRTENAKNAPVSDLKEFFHFYPHGRQPAEMRELSLNLYNKLNQMAAILLQWIEDYLPLAISEQLSMPLRDMSTHSVNTLLRILHYPPLDSNTEEGAVRAAAHEDINLITLLPAATAPGLEVLDVNNNWHSVPCDPGNIVVNVGDMLQRCTQNYYRSTTHRVVNPDNTIENNSRYSMPLFLHPRPDVLLGKDCTAQEYLHERLREIGIF